MGFVTRVILDLDFCRADSRLHGSGAGFRPWRWRLAKLLILSILVAAMSTPEEQLQQAISRIGVLEGLVQSQQNDLQAATAALQNAAVEQDRIRQSGNALQTLVEQLRAQIASQGDLPEKLAAIIKTSMRPGENTHTSTLLKCLQYSVGAFKKSYY